MSTSSSLSSDTVSRNAGAIRAISAARFHWLAAQGGGRTATSWLGVWGCVLSVDIRSGVLEMR